jgi:hypothetical protein
MYISRMGRLPLFLRRYLHGRRAFILFIIPGLGALVFLDWHRPRLLADPELFTCWNQRDLIFARSSRYGLIWT